ncbi:MAG: exo-alpha-sialidase [Ruminococcaceae bacterium]|nr:exo-alpha-sialidase [Oscillospiraceae bacterium]
MSYSYIEKIKSRMNREDVRFYSDIWAPVTVAVPDADAWSTLCVMPDGEIRAYGHYRKESVFQKNPRRCYLSSVDGGLSWKRHMVEGRFTLGASTYVPYLGKYVAVRDAGAEGSFVLIGDDPDDENPMRIMFCEGSCGEIRMLFPMRSRNRVIIVCHEKRPKLHPTAFFAVLYYADGDLRHWTRVPLEAVPFYEPAEGHRGVRWQQNNRENTIEELTDGRLVMISRTALDYHYICYSEDGGETWTKPAPSVFHGTGTMPLLKRLSDGRIVFLWCNTRLLPEREDADGVWEDVFTNRDANHIAISSDEGNTWHGYREIALNPHRNAADFRSLGGPEEGRDKSVHQFEALELPYGKLMVVYGQHYACRRIVIMDLGWLYETSRHENFIHGLEAISSHGYVKSVLGCYRGTPEEPLSYVGHCAYNRVNSALMLPDPVNDGKEVLHICRTEDPRLVSNVGGAVWNFPIAKRGSVTVKLHVAGDGLRISLLDQWVNPSDDEIKQIADFTAVVTSAIQEDKIFYTRVRIDFDCDANAIEVYVNDKFLSKAKLKGTHPNGLCYLHMQSASALTDLKGALISEISFEAMPLEEQIADGEEEKEI